MEIAFIPSWILNRFSVNTERNFHLNILISNLILIFGLYAFYGAVSSNQFLPNICLIDYIFGLECPFCGCTRSLGALYHADFYSAWQYNRVGLILGVFLFTQIPLRIYLMYKNPGNKNLLIRISRKSGGAIIILFFINWVFYLIQLQTNI
jgi:hypothetical protein